jgi:hypothetical protein
VPGSRDRTAWIDAIEPLDFIPEVEVELARFREEMRRCTAEAIRRQMEEGER